MLGSARERFDAWLARRVASVQTHSGGWTAAVLALTLLAGAYAVSHLGVNMDNMSLLAPDLPSEQRARAFEKRFPLLTHSLLVVIDADTPQRARDAAGRLERALAARPDVAHSAYAPEADPFFKRNGLLYRSVDDLEAFSDQLARFQPVVAELAQHPDLPTMVQVVEEALQHSDRRGIEHELATVMERFGAATVAVYAERPLSVSWQDVLVGGTGFAPRKRSTVVVDPVLDYDRLLPAGAPIAAIRNSARQLGLVPQAGYRVRITGYPALNDEEMRGLAMDVGVAGLFSFLMVLAVLGVAFRSGRMVLAAATTLIVGLVWTAAFAAATVVRLNVVSVSFAVLFIGLGVDFSIHLGLHYLQHLRRGEDPRRSMPEAVREVGTPLVICTLTTAIGLFAFMPTDYRGVAELGFISGTGMFLILGLTLTFFPALLAGPLRLRAVPPRGFEPPGLAALGRLKPGAVLLGALAVSALALALAPRVRFDSNVVGLRDPRTESVQTWNDLLASGTASPWYADVLEPDLSAAERTGARLQALPEVSQTLTIRSYIPDRQEEKREILDDLAFLFDVPPGTDDPPPVVSPQEQVAALRSLYATLESPAVARDRSPGGAVARRLRGQLATFLERVAQEPDPRRPLHELEVSLLGNFRQEFASVREALSPQPITQESLPPRLVERMLAPDGSARLQVFPVADLSRGRALTAFVSAVQSVVPEATGLPVNVVEFGRATTRSLRQAVAIALSLIAVLLLVLWRSPGDALRALFPLGLAGLWTAGLVAAIDLPFNFVNVVVLPLLLGIGVDSGIHLVGRARRGLTPEVGLTDTATARAVFWSAITTLVSFGSLGLAGHRGVASLGALLVIGMSCTLLTNLGVLPALLRGRARSPAAQETQAVVP